MIRGLTFWFWKRPAIPLGRHSCLMLQRRFLNDSFSVFFWKSKTCFVPWSTKTIKTLKIKGLSNAGMPNSNTYNWRKGFSLPPVHIGNRWTRSEQCNWDQLLSRWCGLINVGIWNWHNSLLAFSASHATPYSIGNSEVKSKRAGGKKKKTSVIFADVNTRVPRLHFFLFLILQKVKFSYLVPLESNSWQILF